MRSLDMFVFTSDDDSFAIEKCNMRVRIKKRFNISSFDV
jgi:hypothetical protein